MIVRAHVKSIIPRIIMAASPLLLMAAYTISEPADSSQYVATSTIAARGLTQFMGEPTTIKITKGGVIVDSENCTPGEQDIQWEVSFEPPSAGWTLGTNYKCELWTGSPSTKKEETSFSVVVGP